MNTHAGWKRKKKFTDTVYIVSALFTFTVIHLYVNIVLCGHNARIGKYMLSKRQ